MENDQRIRRNAIRAMQAVAAGALIYAGLSCGVVDAVTPCDSKEADGECPKVCGIMVDVDCCYEAGGCWEDGRCQFTGCSIPGPFVPPRMAAA